jgi:endoglucanase
MAGWEPAVGTFRYSPIEPPAGAPMVVDGAAMSSETNWPMCVQPLKEACFMPDESRRLRRPILNAVAVLLVLALAGAGGFWIYKHLHNPLASHELYVVPDTQTAEHAADPGLNPGQQQALRGLADQPSAEWFSDSNVENTNKRAEKLAAQASADGRSLTLVVYNMPNRDCKMQPSGGAANAEQYRQWLWALLQGLATKPDLQTVFIYEPDAVAQSLMNTICSEPVTAAQRRRLMNDSVKTIKQKLPNSVVYLDAGNSGWINNPSELSKPLNEAGLRHADGFAINVSNFQWTEASVAYGKQLAKETGKWHFVIDTSRNGAGPYISHDPEHDPDWCNPPDRKPGPLPTTNTGTPGADAFLWVKRLGESDGSCRPGEPGAGLWMNDYALRAVGAG